MYVCVCVYQFVYLNMPLMSTSLTDASTMGILISGAPSPTSTTTPPDLVACTQEHKHRELYYQTSPTTDRMSCQEHHVSSFTDYGIISLFFLNP